jgi:hypothetical protein
LGVAAVCASFASGADAYTVTEPPAPPNPQGDIPIGQMPSGCDYGANTTSATCENAVIYYLDAARAKMGLGAYLLPPSFPALSPERQIFILSDLDRLAYGNSPSLGLNTELDEAAAQGVARRDDPMGPTPHPGSYQWDFGWASNWAGNFPNAPAAYYAWMYQDEGEGNHWGHRQNILGFPPFAEDTAMGVNAGLVEGERGYAQLFRPIYKLASAPPPLYYTWPDAQAEGAGSYRYDPGTPHLPSAHDPSRARASSLTLRARVKHGGVTGVAIRASRVLLGRRARVRLTRQHVACRARRGGKAGCSWAWVNIGAPRQRTIVLRRHSFIRLRLGAWQREAVGIRTGPFSIGQERYRGAGESAIFFGPKP